MKAITDAKVIEQMMRYEHARRQEDSWKGVREDADKSILEYVNRKYAGVLKRRVRSLCRQHVVSKDRHWWLSFTDVHPSVDHSVSPWSVSARATVRVGLYIHEENEVARDELVISFNMSEIEVALKRLGRMMGAGVACDSKN